MVHGDRKAQWQKSEVVSHIESTFMKQRRGRK